MSSNILPLNIPVFRDNPLALNWTLSGLDDPLVEVEYTFQPGGLPVSVQPVLTIVDDETTEGQKIVSIRFESTSILPAVSYLKVKIEGEVVAFGRVFVNTTTTGDASYAVFQNTITLFGAGSSTTRSIQAASTATEQAGIATDAADQIVETKEEIDTIYADMQDRHADITTRSDQVAADKTTVNNAKTTVLNAQTDVTNKADQVAADKTTVNNAKTVVLDAQTDVTTKAGQVSANTTTVNDAKTVVLNAQTDVMTKATMVATVAGNIINVTSEGTDFVEFSTGGSIAIVDHPEADYWYTQITTV